MEILPIYVFKSSFSPVLELLNKHEVRYQLEGLRSAEPMAASGVIGVIADASIWVSLAAVIVAFIRAKNGREVVITTKDHKVIHAMGLDSKQLQSVLKHAKDVKAIDVGNDQGT